MKRCEMCGDTEDIGQVSYMSWGSDSSNDGTWWYLCISCMLRLDNTVILHEKGGTKKKKKEEDTDRCAMCGHDRRRHVQGPCKPPTPDWKPCDCTQFAEEEHESQ